MPAPAPTPTPAPPRPPAHRNSILDEYPRISFRIERALWERWSGWPTRSSGSQTSRPTTSSRSSFAVPEDGCGRCAPRRTEVRRATIGAEELAEDGARLLDVHGAADYLGVSPRQIKVLTARRELESLLIGRSRRYPLAGLRCFVASRLAEADAE